MVAGLAPMIRIPPHPKWGAPSETYVYERDDGTRCIQAKYRNGSDSPKQCAWWAQGTDGEFYISHGDVRLERLKPYRWEQFENPYVKNEPIILAEGPKDANALAELGFVTSDHRALVADHAEWFHGRDVVIVADRDAPSSATNGGGYRNHIPGKHTPGERAARKAKRILAPVARRITVVTMPGAGVKDAAQWVALHPGTVAEKAAILRETFEHALAHGDDATATQDDDGGLGEWDVGDDNEPIPPRGWLLGNTFCRKFISSLIATGGTGKTAIRIAQALSMTTGRSLTGEHVFRRARVLFVSLEDDRDELRRRVRAAMMHFGISRADVKGWLFLASITGKQWKLATAAKNGDVHRAQLAERLERVIVRHKINAVILDPFVKSHGVPENDNGAVDQVVAILAQIAIDHDCAVDAPHHTNKTPSDPGNANSARGASSFKDAGRLTYTLLPMTSDEAQMLGVPEEERRQLVRVDQAKVNLVPGSTAARWFRLVSVSIGNITADYPNGDSIQVAEPWTPPDMWRDLSPALCCRIIDEIDGGMPEGERYSGAPAARARGAWNVVLGHAPKLTEKQARKVIATWLRNGVLEEREYHSATERKDVKGLFANPAKRPGECANG